MKKVSVRKLKRKCLEKRIKSGEVAQYNALIVKALAGDADATNSILDLHAPWYQWISNRYPLPRWSSLRGDEPLILRYFMLCELPLIDTSKTDFACVVLRKHVTQGWLCLLKGEYTMKRTGVMMSIDAPLDTTDYYNGDFSQILVDPSTEEPNQYKVALKAHKTVEETLKWLIERLGLTKQEERYMRGIWSARMDGKKLTGYEYDRTMYARVMARMKSKKNRTLKAEVAKMLGV